MQEPMPVRMLTGAESGGKNEFRENRISKMWKRNCSVQ